MSVYGRGITRSKHEIVFTDVVSVEATRKRFFFLSMLLKCKAVFVVYIQLSFGISDLCSLTSL